MGVTVVVSMVMSICWSDMVVVICVWVARGVATASMIGVFGTIIPGECIAPTVMAGRRWSQLVPVHERIFIAAGKRISSTIAERRRREIVLMPISMIIVRGECGPSVAAMRVRIGIIAIPTTTMVCICKVSSVAVVRGMRKVVPFPILV